MGDNIDSQFCDLLQQILIEGWDVDSRNEATKRLEGCVLEFKTTPLISVRKTAWKNALREMEWFLSGSNNINDLDERVRHWWKPWANSRGFIWNNYGQQLRRNGCDQIKYAIDTLKNHPNSRRNVISTWHTADMIAPETPITNCHGTVIQLFVNPYDRVDMIMYQRSTDMILGVPHNFIQYWAFLQYLAHQSGRKVGKFTWIGGDCHIYKSHFDIAQEMVKVGHDNVIHTPKLIYKPTSDDFKAEDFSLDSSYKPIIKKSVNMVV